MGYIVYIDAYSYMHAYTPTPDDLLRQISAPGSASPNAADARSLDRSPIIDTVTCISVFRESFTGHASTRCSGPEV